MIRDLSLTVDGDRLKLRFVESKVAEIEEMNEGGGAILLDVATSDAQGDIVVRRFGSGHRRL